MYNRETVTVIYNYNHINAETRITHIENTRYNFFSQTRRDNSVSAKTLIQ